MEWSNNMTAGVYAIDSKNRILISRIKGLAMAIKHHICRYTIQDVINFLDNYSARFSEEELYMRLHGYPDYNKHKAEHERFISDVAGLKGELLSLHGEKHSSYYLSVETNRVMVDWAQKHISKTDKMLGFFLNKKMVFANKPVNT